jgi:hypothetical protein
MPSCNPSPPSSGPDASAPVSAPVASCTPPKPGPAQNGLSEAQFKKECADCRATAKKSMDWNKKMQGEYAKAGADPANKNSDDIEKAVNDSLAAQGITTSVAGTTDTSGNVVVKKSKGPCARVKEKDTEAHEGFHQKTQQSMEAKYGKGTAEFNKHWDDPKEWAQDEVGAYGAGNQFWDEFLKECDAQCP